MQAINDVVFRIQHQDENEAIYLQSGLLTATVASAALSLFPSYRIIGSLATRSLALLSTSFTCIKYWNIENENSRIARCAKIGVIVLGIAAVAVASTKMFCATLVIDTAVNTFELINTTRQQTAEGKPLVNGAVCVINLLTLGSIAFSSTAMIATAVIISAVVMCGLAFKHFKNRNYFEGISHVLLALVNCASFINVTGYSSTTPTNSHFYVRNRHNQEMTFEGTDGTVVARVAPGDVAEFTVPTANTHRDVETHYYWNGRYLSSYSVFKGYQILGTTDGTNYSYFNHDHTDYHTEEIISPLPQASYATLPLAGQALVTEEIG